MDICWAACFLPCSFESGSLTEAEGRTGDHHAPENLIMLNKLKAVVRPFLLLCICVRDLNSGP